MFKSIVLFLLLTLSLQLHANNNVTWRVVDWAPFYILDGEYKGQGLFDELIKVIANEVPESNHKRQPMNTKRVFIEMGKGESVCHPSALKETEAYLSLVNSFLLPHKDIYNKNKPQYFSGSEVILKSLILNQALTAGIYPGRYTEKLNQIVDGNIYKKSMYQLPHYKSLLGMLFAGRVDYIIEYPAVAQFFHQQKPETGDFNSVSIQESNNLPFVPVYFACPKTPWGEKMITKINEILIKESQQ